MTTTLWADVDHPANTLIQPDSKNRVVWVRNLDNFKAYLSLHATQMPQYIVVSPKFKELYNENVISKWLNDFCVITNNHVPQLIDVV